MMGRVCRSCGGDKDASCFTPFKRGKNGLYPYCKECRKPKAREDYLKESAEHRLYYRAKRRATVKGLEFTIQETDIKIPEYCPVLKIPIDTPSLDRKKSSEGYTPSNIRVISNRANMLKNNATIEELKLVLLDAMVIGGTTNDG